MATIKYDDQTSKLFLIASIFWGIVGMLVGVLIALQLVHPFFNFDTSWLTFGRLRPIHTNAVIFAFAGNGIFAGIYYSSQRVLKARMFSDLLSKIHFWGWQLMIVLAAVSLAMGMTQSKEYAELEWPIDLLITVIWVVFAVNFIGTILKRREQHIYVAIWFYLATIITIAVLHIVNSLVIPVNLFKSYSIYPGVQDALVQWWYGHNAVGFFLTTPFLGMLYYFIPKASGQPIYSYRLSIIHFWSLVFLYIWAGPHHLHYTALPDWAQSLGAVFSVMLLAPSWGGMMNGLLTIRGAWDRVRTDPILKFFVAALTFYGMSTFEGPLLSIKSVNALGHYTDWIIGHVHSGALGWNGFFLFAVFYWMVPKLWKTQLYSRKAAEWHFWLGTLGIVFYIVSMWIAGITQGLMWKQFTAEGMLAYPNFIETLRQILPMYWLRALGGTMYFAGLFIMVWNLWKTAKSGTPVQDEEVQVPDRMVEGSGKYWHSVLERRPMLFSAATLVVVLIGGIVELIPTFVIEKNVPTISAVKPYTPLELEGRDIYIREGCYTCHSQMVRPFRDEVARYRDWSKPGEYVYDHPHLWGSRRNGPDLHRVGEKYSNMWHLRHLDDPKATTEGSTMPRYSFLLDAKQDYSWTKKKVEAMSKLGVPYTKEQIKNAEADARAQSKAIADQLIKEGATGDGFRDTEVVALIAYMQRLGTDINKDGAMLGVAK